ncbi:MAG TPA: glycosyltransferase family 4 protein [Gemmataceae bacterium]|nr:glycosyltransferase family 4 protein [Gemmataceae bacterium]
MRALVVNYHARPVGGVETHLRAVLPRLAERVGTLALLTVEGGDPGPSGVPVAGVEWLPDAGDTPDRVANTAARWRPDVVYTHGLGPPAFEAELVEQFPTVMFMHNYGGLCASGTKCHSFPGVRPCGRTLGPGCLALWYPRRCGGTNPVAAVRRYRTERARLRSMKACRAVVVASRHMAAEMVRNGVRADRVHHVPLFPTGATPDPVPPAPRPFSGRVLFVGRLTALKGLNHLLDALPRAAASLGRPLTLVVAGDGPDRAKLEAAARRAGVRAEFLGWVSSDRRDAEMRAADLLAVPSVWPEPFGLVGVEAGCVGLPAVGYAVGGIPDWLEPGVSGESAPGDRPDPRELAAAIVRALADPDHWQRLRVGAWETARRFSPEAHMERLLPILQNAARS